jgi:catechol 2,3-dioxygenase-like lactoylglutathione lyase family enzyme
MVALLSIKTKIMTPRVVETRDWYRDLFGLTVLEEWNDCNGRGCILGLRSTPGEALLEIHSQSKECDFSGVGLQFRVDDVDAFVAPQDERFRSRGPVARPWGSRYLFFTDPNGISVVVFSGTSL